MDKARFIFIDLYTCFQKFVIIGLCQGKGRLFIRDMGHDDPDFYSSFGCIDQGHKKFMIQDQIWGHNMDIILCRIQDIHVHLFSHSLAAIRAGTIGDHKAVIGHRKFPGCPVALIIFRSFFRNIPHFQEHISKVFHSLPLDHHCRVLPVAKPQFAVNIFICQVRSAGKGSFSVNDQDLPVVSVIIMSGKHRFDRGEHFAGDPFFFQKFRIKIGKQGQNTGSVIHYPDLYSFFYFLFQDIQDTLPHFSFRYNKEFQKNKLLRLFQLRQDIFILIISQSIILH